MDPQSDENTPLEGEVVPRDQWLWEEPEGTHEKRYDEETIAEAIRARAMGFKPSEIAERLGCHRTTVVRWCADHLGSRNYGDPDIPKVRAALAVELETASHEAWRIVREAPGTLAALKALNTVDSIARTRANLLGAVAPTRVHVDVKETTQADLELEEMINEARARSWTDADRIKAEFERRNGPVEKPKGKAGGYRPGSCGRTEANPPESSA